MGKDSKKTIRINLITSVIIVMIIVILIGIIIFFCCENKKQKNKIEQEIKKNEILTAEKEKLNEILNAELDEDDLEAYNYFDIIKNSNSIKYNSEEVSNFTEKQIEDAIRKYIKIYSQYEQSTEEFLIKLGLTNRNRIKNYGTKEIASEYYDTDIKFDDYKNALLKYMSEDCFIENFCDDVKSADGILYYSSFESDTVYTYEIKSISKAEDEVNTYEVEYIEKVYRVYDDEEQNWGKYNAYFVITSKDGNPIIEDTDF